MTLAALALTSCSEESPWGGPSEEGAVNLNFSTDGRVMRLTRADDTLSPVVPDGSMFKVDFTKSDNTYSKQWSSVEAFNREKSFSMGDYTLTASYGDLNIEGFDNPYYMGSSSVHVSPGATTDVNVVATLANAMVSIRYTDQFRENFQAYSAAVQTEGHDWVMFAQDENRPAYVAPSNEVKLNLTLTNDRDERVTIQPASFKAEPRHHYVVTIGVTGNTTSGEAVLDIQFDEDVVSESVSVSLGEDLFSAPAPTITAQGFSTDTPINKFEYAELSENPEFHLFAFAGFKSATLNIVAANNYTPTFGKSVNLVGTDDLTQQQIEKEGIGGYFRNVDKMAVVNVKKFLEKLPAGTYDIEVQAVDNATRTSEPLKLTAVITELKISLSAASVAEFMGNEVVVDLTTNSPDVKNVVSFKVPDANNRLVDAKIKSVEDVTPAGASTRADNSYIFRYVLELQPSYHSEVEVQVYMNANISKTATTVVAVGEPEYTITPDAFSNYVVLKIESERTDIVKALIDRLQFYNGETAIPTSNITHDVNNGLVIIKGLTPAVKYLSLKAHYNNFDKVVPEFTTEAQTDVPNGGFDIVSETINISGVQVGGAYRVSPVDYHHTSSIRRSEADGWTSLNAKTCYSESSNKNTWFMVPSSFVDNGRYIVRSVGYNNNGTTPDRSGGAFNTKYYCENAPSNESLNKCAGELFLGSYSFDGTTESRIDGIEFSSRPSSLSFDYSYTAYNSEQAEVSVTLFDKNNNKLVDAVEYLTNANAGTITKTISFGNYKFGEKAVKLAICFKSTRSDVVPAIYIPTGSELNESQSLGNKTISANSYKAFAKGSELIIDNVKLNYDAPAAANPAAKRRR